MMRWVSRFGLVCALAVGCAAGDTTVIPGSVGATSGAIEPLAIEQGGAWQDAPPGCEGHLDDLVFAARLADFTIPARELSLVIVRDANGAFRCVDTYAALEQELIQLDAPVVDGLWLGYVSALQEADTAPSEGDEGDAAAEAATAMQAVMGDPHPQPSRPTGDGRASDGDPHPQPSRPPGIEGPDGEASDGDPHPQPSRPTGDESAEDGDPHPQPSRPTGDDRTEDGDPHPQPSRPSDPKPLPDM